MYLWTFLYVEHNNNKHATPPVHACSTLTMPPAHRRQLRPTGAERPGLTKQKQDRRHLARRRIAARERQLTAGGGRPPPTGRAPPPPPAPPPAASPRRAAATRTTATCAPTRSSRLWVYHFVKSRVKASKQALPHAPSRGLVARTDALWNKLACPREPTGSLSEAIYSPHTQRLTAGPASRASGWPPNRGPKSLAQPERPAANPAGACDARRLRGGLLGARR